MKRKRFWILRVVLTIALVIILFSHTSTRSVSAWSKEELKVLNELINKNTINGWSSSGIALPGEDLNASLSGLKKIQLLIISPFKETIRTYIEHELRQIGIEVIYFKTKVINKQIVITDKDTPIFYVKVNTYKHPHLQLYSYGCKVALIERVSLKRAGSVTCLAQTWWTPILVGTVNKEDMPVAIQSHVAGHLSDFINDYLEANARMSSQTPEDIAEQLNKMRLIITKARHRFLHAAVTVYKLDTGRFPTEEEGFQVLIKPPWFESELDRYLENTEQLKDGWGNNFYYKLNPESGKPFIIISFGADGKEGGEGYDADWPERERTIKITD
ncbi:hypothetical protein GWN26_01565 [Candidatus Saccharibacteria bacterium]|nr:hypothetical protein [Candidatus Saccharibacteria bacterium]NIW78202.1 hypothetical protein [Calditrichia bacterium]